jgi:hypothetical protein
MMFRAQPAHLVGLAVVFVVSFGPGGTTELAAAAFEDATSQGRFVSRAALVPEGGDASRDYLTRFVT